MTALFSRFVVPLLLASMTVPAAADAPSLQELRASLDSAKREAAATVGLDAAYELVGIADAAQQQKAPDIAADATSTLNGVLARATAAALEASIPEAHDAIDQLVDLSFFARTSNVTGADQALQAALRTLLPKVTSDVRAALSGADASPEKWPLALTYLSTLGELQSAATLVMLSDLGVTIGDAFDAEAAKLQSVANDAGGGSRVEDLTAAREARAQQIADAKANDLAAVAAEINGATRVERGETDEPAGGDATVDQTCTETGILEQEGNMYAGQNELVLLEEECVLSGRLPTEDRCPVPNRAFACRQSVAENMERLIYVYRGTPEERTLKDACKGDVLLPAQLNGKTPAFKNTAMRRLLTCTPVSGAMGVD